MAGSKVVAVKGDRLYIDAVNAVASRYGVSTGVLVRDALDKVYGKDISEQLVFFAENAKRIDQLKIHATVKER